MPGWTFEERPAPRHRASQDKRCDHPPRMCLWSSSLARFALWSFRYPSAHRRSWVWVRSHGMSRSCSHPAVRTANFVAPQADAPDREGPPAAVGLVSSRRDCTRCRPWSVSGAIWCWNRR
jgi:hypothetical protein